MSAPLPSCPVQSEASSLLDTINNARSAADLQPLSSSTALQIHAETHASVLARTNFLCPSSIDLQVPYGENLHQCRPTRPAVDAFTAWNKKKCARDNVFNPHARHAGISVVHGQGHAFVVMLLTKLDPDEGETIASDLGSLASYTAHNAVPDTGAVTETDILTRTEWPGSEKENKDPQEDKDLVSESKALDIAHDAFNYMNGARRDAGVHYLRWDEGLYKQACVHSERIFKLERLLHSGKRRYENIAIVELGKTKNAGKTLSEKFLRRRENMLSSSFEYCAIAVVANKKNAYATQLFSRERV